VLAKQMQYATSQHATGTTAVYAGGRGGDDDCTKCHSNEGFKENQAGMTLTAKSDVTPVNCRTCHNIHKNYDETDYDLSTMEPVALMGGVYDGTTIDIGKGNVCANCHQSRPREGLEVGGDNVYLSSKYWGPHHGTQSNYLTGNGGYETAGSMSYSNSRHATLDDGCVTCHMHESNHSFVPDEDACMKCHADIDGIDEYRGVQDDIADLMMELETLLLADSLVYGDHGDLHAVSGQTVSADKAGAVFNFLGLVDDGSLGIHNTKYAKAILTNSIEVFK
jgi:hypothetical protein